MHWVLPGKAVGKDAALQILAKGFADVGLGSVVVTPAVELTGTGQLKPGFEVFGDGLEEQSPLGVADPPDSKKPELLLVRAFPLGH
jgi:hypothetical protein